MKTTKSNTTTSTLRPVFGALALLGTLATTAFADLPASVAPHPQISYPKVTRQAYHGKSASTAGIMPALSSSSDSPLTVRSATTRAITDMVQLSAPIDLSGPGVAMHGAMPSILAQSKKLDPFDENATMTIEFALKPRNQAQMDKLVQRIYNPSDPMFHKFLTSAQRIALFSPTVDDFKKVVYFAQQHRLAVTNYSPDLMSLKATGRVGDIESALGLHFSNYQKPTGEMFFAPDADPTVPQAIAPLLTGILGLENASAPRPGAIPRPSAKPAGKVSPASIGVYVGTGLPAAAVKRAYDLGLDAGGTSLNGAGQTIALLEIGSFDYSNITYYQNYNYYIASPSESINSVPLYVTTMGSTALSESGEAELDIELVEAIADGVNSMQVYEDADDTSVEDMMSQVINDDNAQIVSISLNSDEYGDFEEYAVGQDEEQMALQGQAIFVSSGDKGAYAGTSQLTVNAIAASPYVTGVGGTSLSINIDPFDPNYGDFQSESVWDDGSTSASGGGVSQVYSIPPYQQNYLSEFPGCVANGSSTSMRNVPDVALDSDPYTGYYAHTFGSDIIEGGTSCAAPIWASFWAMANQLRSLNGESLLGFANPALYSIAEGSDYNSDFHDVYSGDNNFWYAGYNYDNATGLGSLDGLSMINDLQYQQSFSDTPSLSGPSYAYSGQNMAFTLAWPVNVPTGYVAYSNLWAIPTNGGSWSVVGSGEETGGLTTATINGAAPEIRNLTEYTFCVVTSYVGPSGTQFSTQSNFLDVDIYPNYMTGLSLSANAAYGNTLTGTIHLYVPAASNELIDLSSYNAGIAQPAASVTIPQGQTSASFAISTTAQVSPATTYIIALPDSTSALVPEPQPAFLTVESLIANVQGFPQLTSGTKETGTINFNVATTATTTIKLKSTNPAIVVPASISVPAGATSATFTIKANEVTTPVAVVVSAMAFGIGQSVVVTDYPVEIEKLTANPTVVVSGKTVTFKLTFDANEMVGGQVYAVTSSDPSISVPSTITVPAGRLTFSFTGQSTAVKSKTNVIVRCTDSAYSTNAALVEIAVKP